MVAGGGFVPQSHIDSVQLTDSAIVRKAKKRYKGKSFIQFSFSSCFRRSMILAWVHFCTVRLAGGSALKERPIHALKNTYKRQTSQSLEIPGSGSTTVA